MEERGRTIRELSMLAGVSVRALRLYDERGLLVPQRQENGYRVYSEEDQRRLQQILLWRACGMPLKEIGQALESPDFDEEKALEEQIALLKERAEALGRAQECAERTLGAVRKGKKMEAEERFRASRRLQSRRTKDAMAPKPGPGTAMQRSTRQTRLCGAWTRTSGTIWRYSKKESSSSSRLP